MASKTQGIATLSMLGAAVDGGGPRLWLNQGGLQAGSPGVFADSGQTLGSSAEGVDLGDLSGWSSATGGLR